MKKFLILLLLISFCGGSSETLILEDTTTDYFTEYMAAAKATLNKNAEKNAFFKKVYDSMKEFADVAVPFWAGAQMSNAKLGMAHAATLK